jgi:hypothetical protein
MCIMFHFKILFAIIFILISDEIFKLFHVIFVIQLISSFQENTQCESSFFADTCTRRVPIFVSAKQIYCYRKRTVPYP